MKTMKVEIPEEVRDRIQAYQFEVESRKDLLAHMINIGVDIRSDNYKAFQDEYREFFVKYSLAKEAMQDSILKNAVPGKLVSWNLNFDVCEVECTYEEG